jgi:hypothetical protein
LSDIQKVGGFSDIIIALDLTITQADLVASIFRDIPAALYRMIWIAPFYEQPSCNYIMTVGYNILAKGKQVGIITNAQNWANLFDDVKGCPEAAKFMLWDSNGH